MGAAARRARHDRGGRRARGRGGRASHPGGGGAAPPRGPEPLREVPEAVSAGGPGGGAAALAASRPGGGALRHRGRGAAGALPGARGGGRLGSLGAPRCPAHPGLRRHRRLAGGTDGQDRGLRPAPDQLAGGGSDRHPGERRCPARGGPLRRPVPDRHRRDQLQARPPLPHRGGGPRQRSAGLGGRRPGRSDAPESSSTSWAKSVVAPSLW